MLITRRVDNNVGSDIMNSPWRRNFKWRLWWWRIDRESFIKSWWEISLARCLIYRSAINEVSLDLLFHFTFLKFGFFFIVWLKLLFESYCTENRFKVLLLLMKIKQNVFLTQFVNWENLKTDLLFEVATRPPITNYWWHLQYLKSSSSQNIFWHDM